MTALRVLGISSIVALGAAVLFLRWAEPDAAPEDLVFLDGDIITMSEPPLVKAIWIRRGRIEKLGSAEELRAAAPPNAKLIDLEGAVLMPGFIEPHTHPLASALLGSAIDVSGFTHDSREGIFRIFPAPSRAANRDTRATRLLQRQERQRGSARSRNKGPVGAARQAT